MSISAGLVLAFTLMIMLCKFVRFRRLLPYHGWVDVGMFALIVFLTWSLGVMALLIGIIASGFLSVFLSLAAHLMDHEVRVVSRSPEGKRQVAWVRVSRKERLA